MQQYNPGEIFLNKYEISSLIGEGAFGAVYKARDTKLDRTVAIKILESSMASLDSFMGEIEAVKRLEHPNIVRLYDYDLLRGGTPCLIMEYVDGRELGDVLAQDGPFSIDRIGNIGLQVLDGLVETHKFGVVHCDLKPENIMLTRTGARSDVVKLIDFGVANLLKQMHSDSEKARALVGTPQYMAPEQIRRETLGPWTDIYAVGLILIELFTGYIVFDAEDPKEVLRKQLYTTVTLPEGLADTELGAVLAKAVAKVPSERYQNTIDFYNSLRIALESTKRETAWNIRRENMMISGSRVNRERAFPSIFEYVNDDLEFGGGERLNVKFNGRHGASSASSKAVPVLGLTDLSSGLEGKRSMGLSESLGEVRRPSGVSVPLMASIPRRKSRDSLLQSPSVPVLQPVSPAGLSSPVLERVPEALNLKEARLSGRPSSREDVPVPVQGATVQSGMFSLSSVNHQSDPSIPLRELQRAVQASQFQPLGQEEKPSPSVLPTASSPLSVPSSTGNSGVSSAGQTSTSPAKPQQAAPSPSVSSPSGMHKAVRESVPPPAEQAEPQQPVKEPVHSSAVIEQTELPKGFKSSSGHVPRGVVITLLTGVILIGLGLGAWQLGLFASLSDPPKLASQMTESAREKMTPASSPTAGVRRATLLSIGDIMVNSAVIGVVKGSKMDAKKISHFDVIGTPVTAGIYVNDSLVCSHTPCSIHVYGDLTKASLEIRKPGQKIGRKLLLSEHKNKKAPIVLQAP